MILDHDIKISVRDLVTILYWITEKKNLNPKKLKK